MPEIIVTSTPADRVRNGADRVRNGELMHRERVDAAGFQSAHFKAQLVQRLGWAIGDAHAAECSGPPSSDAAAAHDGVADPPTSRGAHGR
jgi:hypothetical protein